jgi:hypothetical protein
MNFTHSHTRTNARHQKHHTHRKTPAQSNVRMLGFLQGIHAHLNNNNVKPNKRTTTKRTKKYLLDRGARVLGLLKHVQKALVVLRYGDAHVLVLLAAHLNCFPPTLLVLRLALLLPVCVCVCICMHLCLCVCVRVCVANVSMYVYVYVADVIQGVE